MNEKERALAALASESQRLKDAKLTDTPDAFAAACRDVVEIITPVAAPFHRPLKPRVAFSLNSSDMLAHVINLRTFFGGLAQIDQPIEAIIFTLSQPSDAFQKAFPGVPIYVFAGENMVDQLLAMQKTGHELRLDAVVHVSVVQLVAFAAAIRCARKHIWWAMKWHGAPIPGIDGYIDGNNPFHSGSRTGNGVSWISTYTALPELFRPDMTAIAKAKRAAFPYTVLFGAMARDEKYTPAFAACVGRILDSVPNSGFVYASRAPVPELEAVSKGRVKHLGWVKTEIGAQMIDIMLDTFPFAGGHIAYEAIAAKTPIVFMDLPDGEQVFAANQMKRANAHVLAATNEDEYVSQACAYARGENLKMPLLYRAFYETHLRDDRRMAREVSTAIMRIVS